MPASNPADRMNFSGGALIFQQHHPLYNSALSFICSEPGQPSVPFLYESAYGRPTPSAGQLNELQLFSRPLTVNREWYAMYLQINNRSFPTTHYKMGCL